MKEKIKSPLELDMEKLAKHIQKLSVKHGGIYVSAACCEITNPGMVTYRSVGEELVDTLYFPKAEQ